MPETLRQPHGSHNIYRTIAISGIIAAGVIVAIGLANGDDDDSSHLRVPPVEDPRIAERDFHTIGDVVRFYHKYETPADPLHTSFPAYENTDDDPALELTHVYSSLGLGRSILIHFDCAGVSSRDLVTTVDEDPYARAVNLRSPLCADGEITEADGIFRHFDGPPSTFQFVPEVYNLKIKMPREATEPPVY